MPKRAETSYLLDGIYNESYPVAEVDVFEKEKVFGDPMWHRLRPNSGSDASSMPQETS